jgi:SSS family transporter
MPVRLHALDLCVVGLYLVAITLFGLRFSRRRASAGAAAKDRSLRGYFLANKTIPWWAIALSIVSAETSTLTIIGTPGLAFAGDFGFLQIVIGYMLGRIVVALLFLPKYFQGEMLTAYQLIDRRFGHTLHKVTAGLFLLTRAAAEGVRVFAVSIVVGIAIGTGDVLSIAIISALTLLYTFEGGMAAVIWTDVVQMAIYVGGTLVAIWSLGTHVPGGWATIHTIGAAAGKFHMLNFAMNLTTTYTFWAGVLGGTFLTMASHGTDQLMVQRLLAAKNLGESRLALLSSGVVIFIQFALFLLIGAGLFVFYGMHPAALVALHGANTNRIFPAFIVQEMPVGVAGLLVAAILAAAMSNLSAALNSLSSTTVVDFYMGWRPRANDRERMVVSRASTVLWALVLFVVAVYAVHAGGKGNVVEIGLSIASVSYGCLLGVFLLGTLTRYATQGGAIVGMVTGFALNIALWLQPAAVRVAGVTIPQVAWTWYVIIGALVTFAVGLLASLVFRKQSARTPSATIALLLVIVILSGASRPCDAQSKSPPRASRGDPEPAKPATTAQSISTSNPTAPDFSAVSAAINTAIAQKKLPGAVVVVGHNGKVVFRQAYGVRKLAGEPGLDGKPSPAEPMTADTIFDMASLTKCLVTATAMMQLVEARKVDVDAPVAKYLPEFAANGKQNVTIRELLTHYSGLPPDVNLKDAWGLAAPDKAEGIRRAMNSPLTTTPGTHFEYSDINYIVLGALVEKFSGESLDDYAHKHIFEPLKMVHTRYLPVDDECGLLGFAPWTKPNRKGEVWGEVDFEPCGQGSWDSRQWLPNTAPTQHDDQGTATTNPEFDHLLRGTVHDPTTRRMGGVAGQAGVFSTADDVALFAQALLDRLAGRPSNFPLKRETLQLMAIPQQPKTAQSGATIFTQDGQTTTGVAQRGFGWDINSSYSRPRGSIFPTVVSAGDKTTTPSFGHTGFTGTSLWMDPESDTYVVLLANSVHPRGNPPISTLRGEIATDAAGALGIWPPSTIYGDVPSSSEPGPDLDTIPSSLTALISEDKANPQTTLTGIDVLEATNFAALKEAAARNGDHLRIGLLTNQTGLDAQGRRTIDVLRGIGNGVELTTLFSPEHGIFGAKDSTNIGPEVDPATGLKVISLYGAKDEDRRPRPEDLKNLDAVVIDLQDAGVRFYTYETVLGYFLEAAKIAAMQHHPLKIVVMDRPTLIGGEQVQGPVSDTEASYINYMPLPVRHGMTLGELSEYMNGEHGTIRSNNSLSAPAIPEASGAGLDKKLAGSNTQYEWSPSLIVVRMQNWSRSAFFDQTGVPWVNPSPNLRSVTEATLYPGLGMLDATNVSVGRGTATPFEIFGAGATVATRDAPAISAWFDGKAVAAYLTARKIPGVSFAATTFVVAEDANHYPYHGQTIQGVRLTVTDRLALDSSELGIEILSALHHLYPAQFKLDKAAPLVANSETMAALARGDDPRTIAASWAQGLADFKARRANYLIYH